MILLGVATGAVMPMLISTQRLLKSPPSKGQFRGRTYTDALSGSNLGWIGTVERFEICESSWASTRGFSHLIIIGRGVSNSMSETLDLHRLKAEHMLRRARLAALGESFVILTLLVWLSLEYQNNRYMQLWLARNFWPAQLLLNGTLVGVMTGLLTGWILATWQGKRSKEQKILDDLRKIV